MKKHLFLSLIVFAFGCRDEGDAELANEGTFIRYFGTSDNNVAVLADETADGLILLSNTELEGAAVGNNRMISLIKTDLFGHQVWEKSYPEATEGRNWIASSFIELSQGGYLIVGECIEDNSPTLLLIRTDNAGNVVGTTTIKDPGGKALRGRAVMQDADGNFIVLGKLDDPVNDNFLRKLTTDYTEIWTHTYGAGTSAIANRIYKVENNDLVWGGSVWEAATGQYDVRIIRANEDNEAPHDGGAIVTPGFDEEALDFCEAFGGWAVTGYSNESGTEDIYIIKVSNNNNAQVIFSLRLDGEANQAERGVSISETSDLGFIVLGTAGTAAKKNDLTIAKVNASGLKEWQYNYGGADDQEGASVRVLSDGSYLIFGTTYIINEAKLMLMKVNKDGLL